MPTKIEEKTRELCQVIVDQPEMISIRKRIDTFLSDTQARGQYEAVMSKGQALQEKQAQSQELEGAEIADFEKHRDALLNNTVARQFLDARKSSTRFSIPFRSTSPKPSNWAAFPPRPTWRMDPAATGLRLSSLNSTPGSFRPASAIVSFAARSNSFNVTADHVSLRRSFSLVQMAPTTAAAPIVEKAPGFAFGA